MLFKSTFLKSIWTNLLLVLIISCSSHKEQIDLTQIHKEINHSEPTYTNNFDSIEFVYHQDTIYQNLDIDYNGFIELIHEESKKIDLINTNPKTKSFIKALRLAELCHAAFSFQFLGRKYGLANEVKTERKWDDFSLETQFSLGVRNEETVDCREISNFYRKVLKQEIGLKSRDTSIAEVHTYPIVEITGTEYIMDPTDPFIVFSTSGEKVLGFDALKAKDSIIVKRTIKPFGSSRLLISNALNDSIQSYGANLKVGIKNLLFKKLSQQVSEEQSKKFKLVNKWHISPLQSSKHSTAINLIYQRKIDKKYFKLFYFGKKE